MVIDIYITQLGVYNNNIFLFHQAVYNIIMGNLHDFR
jgi:hypothetical protein